MKKWFFLDNKIHYCHVRMTEEELVVHLLDNPNYKMLLHLGAISILEVPDRNRIESEKLIHRQDLASAAFKLNVFPNDEVKKILRGLSPEHHKVVLDQFQNTKTVATVLKVAKVDVSKYFLLAGREEFHCALVAIAIKRVMENSVEVHF